MLSPCGDKHFGCMRSAGVDDHIYVAQALCMSVCRNCEVGLIMHASVHVLFTSKKKSVFVHCMGDDISHQTFVQDFTQVFELFSYVLSDNVA